MFVSDVPLYCINEAAEIYHVPATIIIAVLNVEQGKVGMANKNKNGTYDLGPMQINSSWWPKLSAYGITKNEVQYSPCVNVKVGAWILASAIADGENLVNAVGNYHSHTPKYNQRYSAKVRTRYTQLNQILNIASTDQ